MPQDLFTGLNSEFPPSFVTVDENLVFVANGVDKILRWNGQRSSADTAGVIAPTQTLNVTSPNAGAVTISTGARAYQRFVDYDGNVSNFSPASASFTCSSKKVLYANIEVPTETKVSRRQIFRTLDGGSAVVYLDVDTTDLTSTSIESNNPDSVINFNEAVVLQDSTGTVIGNVHGVPPSNKSVLVAHQGRMFGLVERSYTTGHVDVVNGSTAVGGIGTYWTQAMVGRYLYVVGSSTFHLIQAIGTPTATGTQSMTLASAYTGPTDRFAEYAVRSHPDHRRGVAFCESLQYQSWPEQNEFTIQETGSEITGGLSLNSFLYILEGNRIHRMTYQDSPEEDGAVFPMAYRGCVNQRAFAVVEGMIYMLDEQGIHRYDGAREVTQVSTAIQDLFRRDGHGFRINWRASKWIHAVHYPAQETIRWFVPLSGMKYPRHALCYHHALQRFWVEEYPFPIGSSTQVRIDRPIAVVGTRGGSAVALGEQALDGVPSGVEPYGTVSSASVLDLTDQFASFQTNQIANVPVVIVRGRGKRQLRHVVGNDATTLTLRYPWLVLPDGTSEYQIGGIPWRWVSGHLRWVDSGDEEADDVTRFAEVIWGPVEVPAWLDLRIADDFQRTAKEYQRDVREEGIEITAGEADIVVDLTRPVGTAVQRMDQGHQRHAPGNSFFQIEMRGVGVNEEVLIHELNLGGTG